MSGDFKGNIFDEYAYRLGGWAYDNGWRYKGEFFGAAYVGEVFEGAKSGEQNYLLMLRDGNTPDRTIILHKTGDQLNELWSGQVETKDDFDNMMNIINTYIKQYKSQNKAG
jgi:hypothetical protein